MLSNYCTRLGNNAAELHGLPILPTAAAGAPCSSFAPKSSSIFYVCDEKEYALLEQFPETAARVVSNSMPSDLIKEIKAMNSILDFYIDVPLLVGITSIYQFRYKYRESNTTVNGYSCFIYCAKTSK